MRPYNPTGVSRDELIQVLRGASPVVARLATPSERVRMDARASEGQIRRASAHAARQRRDAQPTLTVGQMLRWHTPGASRTEAA